MPHPIQPGGGGGGGGGTPSLPFNSVQYNNAGAFGGSANFTWDGTGVVVTDGAGITDTLSPGTLLFTTAGTGTVSVKTGGGADGPLNLDILDLQVNGASGLAGQVLTSGGPGASPTWAAVAGTPPITVVNTTPYAAAANTFLVVKPSVSTIVVNLPAGVLDASIIVKHGNDSLFDVQVNANGAETIDGQGSYLLTTRQSITITFEGGVWHTR